MARGGRLIFAPAFRDDDPNSVLVSGLIRSALESYPIHLWSLFTGMIWVSDDHVGR